MGTIIFEDLSKTPRVKGYYNPKTDEIFVDSSLSKDKQTEVLVHEVLESCLHQYIKHSYIEILTSKIYLALRILKAQDGGAE